ncbi:hypothetical protein HMPREF9429_00660 [Megasphaera micronuciformis F0359]|uniref:Uncharacterized protein n=1 Tax=Megasphaera micronuciformis F0359 TaxID=706434 RepID=E2ZB34_9FIRM|nr:hypothetical protein HMPREF9429_00660 [Megasphaera micronuciformis F0359]
MRRSSGGWEKRGQQAPTLLYAVLSHIGKVFFYKKNQELVIMNKFDNLIKKHEFNSFINY